MGWLIRVGHCFRALGVGWKVVGSKCGTIDFIRGVFPRIGQKSKGEGTV